MGLQCAEQMLAAAGQALRVVAECLANALTRSAPRTGSSDSSSSQHKAALDLCYRVRPSPAQSPVAEQPPKTCFSQSERCVSLTAAVTCRSSSKRDSMHLHELSLSALESLFISACHVLCS